MAIDLSNLVEKYKLDIKGILHIGAHQGDSLSVYNKIGISLDKIIWISTGEDIKSKYPTVPRHIS